ncbi:hypothetical protein RF11_14189 [Thelohanellus kitauei]|uniref:Serpin domain-containing protein n=1 Tax=Thelohanellus kitauei TaxID=669202 RepID=A0A0C2NIC4_THEKT|nr:hypothetical protein RF11_14189 [Thelohanellus kitauei]
MLSREINSFTLSAVRYFFEQANNSGNLAFSGLNNFLLLGVIDLGLRGESGLQLSNFLNENFLELRRELSRNHNETTRYILDLLKISLSIMEVQFEAFGSIHILSRYKKLVDRTLGFPISYTNHKIPFKFIEMGGLFYTQDGHSEGIFFIGDNESKRVEYMRIKHKFLLNYDPNLGANILFLPLKNRNVFGAIILPRYGKCIKRISTNLERYFDEAKLSKVYLTLPKIRIIKINKLRSYLMNKSVDKMFIYKEADMSGMSRDKAYVLDIYQQSIIVFNENGKFIIPRSQNSNDNYDKEYDFVNFLVDKPFIFYTYVPRNKTVLFMSVIKDP